MQKKKQFSINIIINVYAIPVLLLLAVFLTERGNVGNVVDRIMLWMAKYPSEISQRLSIAAAHCNSI